MNLIQSQADDFFRFKFRERGKYEDFVQELRWQLSEYHKTAHKLEFIDRISSLLRNGYDKHLVKCKYPDDRLQCSANKNYENALFFAQNEKEKLSESLDSSEISLNERSEINESLNLIIADLEELKLGQQITYDDLFQEFEELKEMYFLNKKNWRQLVIGRLSEMVASGIVSETISKSIIDILEKHWVEIIK